VSIPADKIEEYNNILGELILFKQHERENVRNGLLEMHPVMHTVRGQIDKLNQQKAELIKLFPALANITLAAGSTNSPGASFSADVSEIKRLTARVAWLGNELSNRQASARSIIEIEPLINSWESQVSADRTNLQMYINGLESARTRTSFDPSKQVSIKTVEEPTPPSKDTKKLKKLLGAVFGGFFGFGLGLAFLIDFVLDRSIKRSVDIERHLHLPVLQSVPDLTWSARLRLPWSNGAGNPESAAKISNGKDGHANGAVALWDPVQQLQPYTEGLRERLMTHFEVNNLNLKKPKLVGLTACARGCGVTTLASGLAASLSRVGGGTVLLVDMNSEEGATQAFHQGQAQCSDLLDALAHGADGGSNGEASRQNAAPSAQASNKLVKVEPGGIVNLMPKIKGSDYDYIIFDLPPVSQTNSTARLAGYMDLTLLVVESEKTGQQLAVKANALMGEANARVATVLNKCRRHVPEKLSQEL
jgi:Mrp family chromosome partitioning ATPase